MQNEFEKQVRAKMDELNFVPTEPVWEKIEEQIRHKRDRRRVILWLPLLLILLSAGIVWTNIELSKSDRKTAVIESKFIPHQQQDIYSNQSSDQSSVSTNTPVSATSLPTTSLSVSNDNKNNDLKNQEPELRAPSKSLTGETVYAASAATGSRASGKKSAVKNSARTSDATNKSAANHQTVKDDGGVSSDGVNVSTDDEEIHVFEVTDVGVDDVNPPKTEVQNDVLQDVEQKNDAEEKTLEEIHSVVDSAASQPNIKRKKQNAWQIYASVQGGISGISSGLNLLDRQKDLVMDLTNFGTGTSNPPITTNSETVSTLERSAAFSAGAGVKKQLGNRLAFSVGLQYSYYSTQFKVGRDTVANGIRYFYGLGISEPSDYTNTYHFASIPLGFEFKIFKHTPLFLNTSFALGQMIHTNALAYDDVQKVYYQERDAIRKTQLFAGLGLDYGFQMKNGSLHIGPQVQYGLSDLERGNSDRHLYALGLRMQYLFQK